MNRKHRLIIGAIVLTCLIAGAIFLTRKPKVLPSIPTSQVLEYTWTGYKNCFITPEGRVMRPKHNDTVSEGQAYAMLRAVWMRDKTTFDACYRWTEENLSRFENHGDHLLAWKWKGGVVTDWMPASDADIDYALSLLCAASLWPDQTPEGSRPYSEKAINILKDILNKETFRTDDKRLYLSPWILTQEAQKIFPQNPSYYSPAHFRVFHKATKDDRWLELVNTTYDLLFSLTDSFAGKTGVGLFPDWCAISTGGHLLILEGKNDGFGWDAVRIPFRIAMDALWFDAPEAREILSTLNNFTTSEWSKNQQIFCEYEYSGNPIKKYENPAFYAAYASAALAVDSHLYKEFSLQGQSFLREHENGWIYIGRKEYYVNSLAWIADGLALNAIQPPSNMRP